MQTRYGGWQRRGVTPIRRANASALRSLRAGVLCNPRRLPRDVRQARNSPALQKFGERAAGELVATPGRLATVALKNLPFESRREFANEISPAKEPVLQNSQLSGIYTSEPYGHAEIWDGPDHITISGKHHTQIRDLQ
jgi:hypothetical protein